MHRVAEFRVVQIPVETRFAVISRNLKLGLDNSDFTITLKERLIKIMVSRRQALAESADRNRGFSTLEKVSVNHVSELSREAHEVEWFLIFGFLRLAHYAPSAVTDINRKCLCTTIL